MENNVIVQSLEWVLRHRDRGVAEQPEKMANEPEDLTLRFLRRIDENVVLLRADVAELKGRMSDVERQLGRNAASEMEHYASVMGRMDRLEGRIERIERRAEIFDA